MYIKTPFSHRGEEPENSVLYIVGTPIGSMYDISPRALRILKKVNLIACEDTRQTKKIMSKFDFKNNLISFNKYNSLKKIPSLISELKKGSSVALVSDAGMPGICDPGEDLIREARVNNIDVICIPGPCAATTALVSSGMSSSSFVFEGFLPKKGSEREKVLLKLSECEKTTIIFEAPHRLRKLINELKEYCGGNREIIVFRELTKKFETHIGHNIDQVLEFFEDKEVIGEITLVIKGFKKTKNSVVNSALLKKELHDLINAGLTLSSASKYLSKKNGLKKSIIYNLQD